jgi:LacI family transcriptional regulator
VEFELKKKPRVTSFDVAERAGVSRSVVSAVLNGTPGIGVSEDKRKAVLQAIEELHYKVDAGARAMKTGRSQCLAAYGHVSNPLFLQVLEGMQSVCEEQGYHVLLYGSGEEPSHRREGLVDLYRERRIDGVISLDRPQFDSQAWVELVLAQRLPYVSVEGYPEERRITSILMDYRDSIRRALHYLHDRTGLRPEYIELRQRNPLGFGDLVRRKAYVEWMEEQGYEPLITEVEEIPWEASSAFWCQWLSDREGESTVLTNWSRGSMYLHRAAQITGRKIGESLHFMSADNTERVIQHLYPAVTSIEVPYVEMGRLAASHLIQAIEGRERLEHNGTLLVPAVLVERNSVGRKQ